MEHLIEYKEMREAIARVRELHSPITAKYGGETYCFHCWYFVSDLNIWASEPYPCPTLKALDGEQ